MRAIFTDQQTDDQFQRDGVVLLRGALGGSALARVQEFYATTRATAPGKGAVDRTRDLPEIERRWESHQFLASIFRESLGRHLDGMRPVHGSFLAKRNGPSTAFKAHQDWAFVDESRFCSVNAWAPLVDTNHANGVLAVARGSHRLLRPTLRGPNLPFGVSGEEDALFSCLSPVPMEAGDVLVWDHRLVHGSGANTSGETRPAFTINLVPIEATPVRYVYFPERPGSVTRVEIDERFLVTIDVGLESPDGVCPEVLEGWPQEELPYEEVVLDEDDLRGLAGRSLWARAWRTLRPERTPHAGP